MKEEGHAGKIRDGSRSAEPGRISIFRIGSKSLGSLSVLLTPARENEHRWENGLLPTSLFQAIYFNHQSGYVILNPRVAAAATRNHRQAKLLDEASNVHASGADPPDARE